MYWTNITLGVCRDCMAIYKNIFVLEWLLMVYVLPNRNCWNFYRLIKSSNKIFHSIKQKRQLSGSIVVIFLYVCRSITNLPLILQYKLEKEKRIEYGKKFAQFLQKVCGFRSVQERASKDKERYKIYINNFFYTIVCMYIYTRRACFFWRGSS